MKRKASLALGVGLAVLVVIGGASLAIIHGRSSTATAAKAVVASPAPLNQATRSGPLLADATVGQRPAVGDPPPAGDPPAVGYQPPAAPVVNTARKGDGDPVADSAGVIAARYERGPQYQIRVGASPLNLRATHPVDLYMPPHDPMFNIQGQLAYPPLTSESAFVSWMTTHTPQKNVAFLREKWQLAAHALRNGYLTHRRVLMAFLLTPREWFVRAYNFKNAYENTPLPIGWGQTITDPETVIAMTNALDPQPNQRVLEIGTGSGYQSAILSELSNYVYTMEIVVPLAEETNQLYMVHTSQMPQYANIHRRVGDGYYGWPSAAPFDRIIVTTGIDHIPPILIRELKPGGIMLIPVGPPTGQTILVVRKTIGPNGGTHLSRQVLPGFAHTLWVPFTSSSGGTHSSGG